MKILLVARKNQKKKVSTFVSKYPPIGNRAARVFEQRKAKLYKKNLSGMLLQKKIVTTWSFWC